VSVAAGVMKLNTAMKTLLGRWDEVGDDWDDAVRRDFEENYLEPLRAQTQATVREMERLGEVLRNARRHCDDVGQW
jgi:hypothetical protein